MARMVLVKLPFTEGVFLPEGIGFGKKKFSKLRIKTKKKKKKAKRRKR